MFKKIALAALLLFPGAALAQNATTAQPAYLGGNPVTVYQSWSPNGDGTYSPLGQSGGNVASGTADTGNPIKIGGVVDTNPSATVLTTGSRANLRSNPTGELYVAAGTYAGTAGTDSIASLYGFSGRIGATSNPVPVAMASYIFNGAAFDRQRGNIDTAALVTLTAASAGVNSADQTNYNGRGVKVGVNVTALSGTAPTLTVTVQGKDAASGVYYNLLVGTVIAATGFTTLTLYPGETVSANVSSSDVLPRTWRIVTTIGGTTPAVTATVGASVIN